MQNSRVNNATPTEYDGIKFLSKLEVTCYKLLLENNLKAEYSPKKFCLFPTIKLAKVSYFCPIKAKKSKDNKPKDTKTSKRKKSKFIYSLYPRPILQITYTPDFYVEYKNCRIFFDTKGKANDTYPLKKKMFLAELEKLSEQEDRRYIFFEPHNKKQILQSIEIIKSL